MDQGISLFEIALLIEKRDITGYVLIHHTDCWETQRACQMLSDLFGVDFNGFDHGDRLQRTGISQAAKEHKSQQKQDQYDQNDDDVEQRNLHWFPLGKYPKIGWAKLQIVSQAAQLVFAFGFDGEQDKFRQGTDIFRMDGDG